MEKPFFERLGSYYKQVILVLKGEADAASVFPNPSDIGMCREHVYLKFLQQHVPSKCNVFLGGYLFGYDGTESKQIDIVITMDKRRGLICMHLPVETSPLLLLMGQ